MAVAEQHLRAFVDQSGTTAMLSVWSERGPIVIRWMQGRRAVYTTISIGSLMSIETSATGAAFLAWLDAAERDRALASMLAKRRSQLVKRAAEVRRTGYAQVEGDFVPGLYAMAVPVVSGRGDLVATFTAVTAGETISVETRKALQQAAAAAGTALGQRINKAAP